MRETWYFYTPTSRWAFELMIETMRELYPSRACLRN